MLPAALPLSAADARRWVRAGLPRWVTSVGLTVGWALAVAVAIATDNTQCTPQDPSVCGPDSVFAFCFVVTVATPVLLFWMPVLGCTAGALFALADVRYDDVTASRWAFGLHGLLCALVGLRLLRGAAEQRRIASAASAGNRLRGGFARPAAPSPRLLVAGLLVLAGVGFFAWYAHQVSDERAHLRRAVPAQAWVVEVRPDDSIITVEVRTPSAGTRKYEIGVYDSTDPYPVHSNTPVLLDPRDPGWIRLVAEPQDVTYWQSAGAGSWLLAFLLLLHAWRWRRSLRALGSDEQPALGVRIRPDGSGRALILPASGTGPDAERPIARLAVLAAPRLAGPDSAGSGDYGWDDEDDGDGWDYETQEEFGRIWRDEGPAGIERFAPPPPALVEDAVLVGELSDHGVAMLVTADNTLLPAGRLRVGWLRERPPVQPGQPQPGQREPGGMAGWWQRLVGSRVSAEPELFAGAAVQPADMRLPELPVTVRPRVRVRLAGAAMLLAAFAGYPVAEWWGGLSLYSRVLVALGLGRLAAAGAARLLSCLRLSHAWFEISGPWWTHSVPWDRLHGVRRDGERLSVAWQPDTVVGIGPFDDPAGARGRQDRAERLGATMMLLRRRALLGGLPGRQTSRRPNATWLVLAGYAALVLFSYYRQR